MRKYLNIFILVVAAVLAFGWYKIEKLPDANSQNFSAHAAEAGNTSFSELSKGKVTRSKLKTKNKTSAVPNNRNFAGDFIKRTEKGRSVEVDYMDTSPMPNCRKSMSVMSLS